MPHVELSLTEDARRHVPRARQPVPGAGGAPAAGGPGEAGGTGEAVGGTGEAVGGSLGRWAAATAGAHEPCLVVRSDAAIVAVSASCAALLGIDDPATAPGRPLREALGQLVDFTTPPSELDSTEADKIPPLLAISSGRLARGLMRLVCQRHSGASTLDAIATPLFDGQSVTGSLTFFSEI